MQGTMHVRSLLRLLIGAALLCLAWVVLTSGAASAAERHGPSKSSSEHGRPLSLVDPLVDPLVDRDGLESVLGDVLGTTSTEGSAAQPVRPAKAAKAAKAAKPTPTKASPNTMPKNEKPSGTTTSTKLVRTVDAAVGQAAAPVAVLTAPVDAGLVLVTDVADALGPAPLIGEPLVRVTDVVTALVRSLPPVDVPAPIAPLPIGDGIPTAVVPVPAATEGVAPERDPSMTEGTGTANPMPTEALRLSDRIASSRHVVTARVAVTARAGTAAAPQGRGQPAGPSSPLDPSPVLPSQPSPTGGVGQGAGDPATASANVVLPKPSSFGRSSADWRVPRGLPAHPGTRPD